jgi:hypothetical protein
VLWNGVVVLTPALRSETVGSAHTLSVTESQGDYRFRGWAHGGSREQQVTVGGPLTYTAMFSGPTLDPTPAPSPAPRAIYDDALASGWSDWSWGTTRDLANTDPVAGGQRSLSFRIDDRWSGLMLAHRPGVATGSYTHLQFAMQGTTGTHDYILIATDAANAELGRVALSAVGCPAPVGGWFMCRVPLARIGAANVTLGALTWLDAAGAGQARVYLDEVALVAIAAGATGPPARYDANADGFVGAVDALCILRGVGDLPATPVCPRPLPGGDANGDAMITAVDALCVLRWLSGLPETSACPVGPPSGR